MEEPEVKWRTDSIATLRLNEPPLAFLPAAQLARQQVLDEFELQLGYAVRVERLRKLKLNLVPGFDEFADNVNANLPILAAAGLACYNRPNECKGLGDGSAGSVRAQLRSTAETKVLALPAPPTISFRVKTRDRGLLSREESVAAFAKAPDRVREFWVWAADEDDPRHRHTRFVGDRGGTYAPDIGYLMETHPEYMDPGIALVIEGYGLSNYSIEYEGITVAQPIEFSSLKTPTATFTPRLGAPDEAVLVLDQVGTGERDRALDFDLLRARVLRYPRRKALGELNPPGSGGTYRLVVTDTFKRVTKHDLFFDHYLYDKPPDIAGKECVRVTFLNRSRWWDPATERTGLNDGGFVRDRPCQGVYLGCSAYFTPDRNVNDNQGIAPINDWNACR